jgi:hypothetical protein
MAQMYCFFPTVGGGGRQKQFQGLFRQSKIGKTSVFCRNLNDSNLSIDYTVRLGNNKQT